MKTLLSSIMGIANRGRDALANFLRGHRPAFYGDIFGLTRRERRRLQGLPQYHLSETSLLGHTITINDPYWYLFMYREIMVEGAYKFRCEDRTPLIVDCGSNIGLSIVYFKSLYPGARIIAFEPDLDIYQILQSNMAVFGYADVELRNSAVWVNTDMLNFQPDHAVGGHLCLGNPASNVIRVQSERLYDFLDQNINFLKIDIEGAELEVLEDCRDRLVNVERLFVEYHGKPNRPQNLESLLSILRLSGFRYHIKDANPILNPFL